MKTVKFKNCHVEVFCEACHLATVFEDGRRVEACPNYDTESIQRAQELGYGNDLWAMTVDHEICHTLLAETNGQPYSPALWAVAHPEDEREADEVYWDEEDRVLKFQKLYRTLRLCRLSSGVLP